MTTRRTRFERNTDRIERRLEKRREERFVKGLEDARDTLDDVIEQATMGDSKALDALADFSEQMERVYSQAERMEDD